MAVKKLDILYSESGISGVRCSVEKWEFHDTVMGEQYIIFNHTAEKPVEWAIGDYLIYRGQVFYLNYVPTCVQTAKMNDAGDGFAYEQVKFDSAQDELQRCVLLDITPTTGDYIAYKGTNYTGSAVFSLFCGETVAYITNPSTGVVEEKRLTAVTYLAGIIQANLNRLYGPNDGWTVKVNYDTTHTDDFTLSINNWTVAQALQEVHNTFKLDYVVQGRTILIGFNLGDITGNTDEEFMYGYGRGYPTKDDDSKGLFKIKRTANSSQKIITRLRAVGSTKNMPYRYYNKNYPLPQSMFVTNLQLPNTFLPYSEDQGQGTKTKGNEEIRKIYPDVRLVLGESNDAYIDKDDDASSCSEGIREAVAFWDGSDAELEEIYPTIKESTYGELRAALIPDQDGTEGQSAFPNYGTYERIDTILNIDDDVNIGDGIMAESSVNSNNTVAKNVKTEALLYALSEMSRSDKIFTAPEILLFQVKGVDIGKYQMSPVITGTVKLFGVAYNQNESENAPYFLGWKIRIALSNGVTYNATAEYSTERQFRFSSVFNEDMPSLPINLVDGTQYLDEIYVEEKCDVNVYFAPYIRFVNNIPSTGDLLYQVQLDTSIEEQDDIKCEYVWGPVNEADTFMNTPFHIMVKDMGIDFKNVNNTGEDPVIHMNSGGCVGREFKISDAVEYYVDPSTNKKGWKLELTRVEDSSIHAYYPNENQQINKDDEFVILNIDFPEAYIKAAEIRLLRAATDYLADNCETKYTYEPFIDDIYLQRNIDFNDLAGTPTKSVYWNLYAGYKFSFRGIPETAYEDDPLPIIQSITIQSVTIKEGDKETPQVEIVLNDDLEQTTIQKLTTSVDRIYGSIFNTSSGGTSSASMNAALRSLLTSEGGKRFLSKLTNDTAQGLITFLQGLKVGDGVYGFDGEGDITARNINGAEALFEKLTAQEAHFFELIIDEVKSVGGQLVITPANCVAELVEETSDGWRVYFQAQDGERTIRNEFQENDQALHYEFDVTDGTTRNYWRLVTAVSSTPELKEIDGVEVYCHWIDLSNVDCRKDSDEPKAGDNISMLGNRNDEDRQNAIVISAYNIPFIDSAPYMGDASGIQAPLFATYSGVNSYAITESHRVNVIAGNGNTFRGRVDVGSTLADGRPVNELGTAEGNLLRNTYFAGDYESEEGASATAMEEDTPLWSEPLKHWSVDAGTCEVQDDASMKSGRSVVLNGQLSQTVELVSGLWYMLSVKARGTSLSVTVGGVTKTAEDMGVNYSRFDFALQAVSTSGCVLSGVCEVGDIILTQGSLPVEWSRSPLDPDRAVASEYKANDYLRKAISEASTSILGGLILSNIIKVGNYGLNAAGTAFEMKEETGGMSGAMNHANSPFLWGGGDMEKAIHTIDYYKKDPSRDLPDDEEDAEAELAKQASFVVTHGGRAILNDIVLRGYIHALGGVFRNVRSPNGSFDLDASGNVTINGTIYATSGYIGGTYDEEDGWTGGFEIAHGRIGKNTGSTDSTSVMGMGLFEDFICFNAANRQAIMGTGVSSTARLLARFLDTGESLLHKTGVCFGIENSSVGNHAFTGTGHGTLNSVIEGYKLQKFTFSTSSEITLNYMVTGNRFLVKSEASSHHLMLPRLSDIRAVLYESTSTPFAFRLTVMGDVGTTSFNLYGRHSSYTSEEYPLMLDEDAGKVDSITMGAGDSIELMLVYDPDATATVSGYSTYYTARVLNRNY